MQESKEVGINRVIIYARISDRKQLDGASLETQVANCTKHALAENWYIVRTVQEVHTGTEYRERKLLSQVRGMVRNNEADIVWFLHTFGEARLPALTKNGRCLSYPSGML